MKTLKPIRSFVRRERRLGKVRQEAVKTLWDQYVIDYKKGMFDPKEFGNKKLNIEIGFGMGDSLFAMVLANPNEYFIGIEVHLPGVAALLTKLKNHPLPNIKIYNHDAIEILNNCIPNNCIDKILLFFPDPWQKRRHNKRRIVQSQFVQLIHNKLKTDGYFHVATDIKDYALHTIKTLHANNFHQIEINHNRPLTKFEQRGINNGRKIWDLVFTKNPTTPSMKPCE